MRPVLIYPPLTDPTCGYHSLCYLDSYARAHGQAAADIIDATRPGPALVQIFGPPV